MLHRSGVAFAPCASRGEGGDGHYVGIDVSLDRSSVCVVDPTGRIVREAKVASEPEALVCLLEGLRSLRRLGFFGSNASRRSRVLDMTSLDFTLFDKT